MDRRWLLAFGSLAGSLGLVVARWHARRRRGAQPAATSVRVVEIARVGAWFRVTLEAPAVTADGFPAVRCWLSDETGVIVPAQGLLRVTSSDPVREIHTLPASDHLAAPLLHVSAGRGQPELVLAVPPVAEEALLAA